MRPARLCAALLLLVAAASGALEPEADPGLIPALPTTAATTTPRPVDALGSAGAREAWLEGVVRTRLAASGIPGAAIAIVDTEGPALVEGFGYADVVERRPVDPERSLFRIASITKTFTWAAIMRLVLDGRLDLATDVDEYTNVSVPVVNGRPVTLADLMTHSAGFEDRGIGFMSPEPLTEDEFEAWLIASRPAVVYPPGRVPAYSNYGTALAGQIAARAAQRPWAELVDAWFLVPLAMTHTHTAQPLPAAAAADFAPGHRRVAGALEARPFGILRSAPAGAMSATAADMARWLEVHLTGGRLAGEQVLDAALVAAMAEPLRSFHPERPPFLHGFYRMDRAGERIHGHHGDIEDTQSVLAIFPERGIGVFAVFNAYGGNAADAVLDAVVERLQAHSLPEVVAPPADFAERAGRYVGEYASSRRNHSTLERAALLASALEVSATADDHLVTRWPGGPALQWVETAPDSFRARDGRQRLLFEETDDGALRLWIDGSAATVYERLGVLAAPSTHRLLLAIVATVFVLCLFGYPAGGLLGGREQMVFGETPSLPGGAVTLAWFTSALGLLVTALLFIGLGDAEAFLLGVPRLAVVGVWTAAAFGTVALLSGLLTLLVLRAGRGTFAQRLRLATVTAAGLVQLTILVSWNLMPWGLP